MITEPSFLIGIVSHLFFIGRTHDLCLESLMGQYPGAFFEFP